MHDDSDEEESEQHDLGSEARGEEDDEGSDAESEGSGEGSEGGKSLSDDSDTSREAVPPTLLAQVDEDEDATSRFGSRIAFKPRATNSVQPSGPSRSRPLASSYESMGISSVLISALAKMSIKTPTEIQAACIPPLLEGEFRCSAHVFRLF